MSARLDVDIDLVRKYDVPGPRYTSYPTAVEFGVDFQRAALLDDLRRTGNSPSSLSLYVHLPFCESLCWFCGCTTVTGRDHSQADPYLDRLERELAMTSELVHRDSRVVQLHLGGGTPNFLTPEQIARLGRMLASHFQLAPDAEYSVELDPRRLSMDQVRAFRAAGVTRASFGIQDFDPDVQTAIHRVQPKELSDRAASWIRAAGYESLNVDLVYGLPHQTVASFERTIALACELRPNRFSVFSYAHVPWLKPAQKLLPIAYMPSPETKLAMLKMVIERLTANGYVYIGMDHFALENDELALAQRAHTVQRNFQGYSTRAGSDIYGFGMSSISQSATHYRQNEKTLDAYYARVDRGELPISRARWLTEEDRARRHVIWRLMCDLSLDYRELSAQVGFDFCTHFARELAALRGPESDGLVTLGATGLTVTDQGRLFVRNLAMIFDAYLDQSKHRFSRTV
jgi:oxygen-independent coproporphyrinogen III oxidase